MVRVAFEIVFERDVRKNADRYRAGKEAYHFAYCDAHSVEIFAFVRLMSNERRMTPMMSSRIAAAIMDVPTFELFCRVL